MHTIDVSSACLGLLRLLMFCIVLIAPARGAVAETALSVFVSVVPQRAFLERVGGDQVRVQVLVPPGQSPHAYEPTPRQVAALSRADLYVRIGVPFEDVWLPRIRAANPGLRVLDARDGVRARARTDRPGDGDGTVASPDEHGHDADHGHQGPTDSHVWTSPVLVKAMGPALRDALTALRPGQGDLFAANNVRFAADLDALDAEIRARLAPLRDRRFLVFHPAWGYFADTYGLVQIPIEREGKEPGARALTAVINQARSAGIKVVLAQPQMRFGVAQQVAAAIGGRVEVVDPLSADYFGSLLRLAEVIAGIDGE